MHLMRLHGQVEGGARKEGGSAGIVDRHELLIVENSYQGKTKT
jgi:hypothetical protein